MNLRYLLLTGKQRCGHQRTSVSVFATVDEASAEFGIRRRRLPAGGWLELLSIDELGHVTRIRRSDDQLDVVVQAATQRSASVGSAPMWTCT